ncbi:MAG: RNA polymerase sigma factor (sigma-70 family) [Patiriisocius sp.]|jgi:RNA polymerase sigma factor (sigma-70 family)
MPKIINLNQELLEQCMQRNPVAQRKIYDMYVRAMFNTSLRIVNQREDAEDVVQESFVTAFGTIDKVKDLRAFGGWLKRIVINKSLNVVKKKKLKFVEMEYDLKAEEADETLNEWSKFSIQHIKQAILKLPDGYKAVFSLYMFEDFSHKEIASQLGITESTSKSQLNRAKHKLKEMLIAL